MKQVLPVCFFLTSNKKNKTLKINSDITQQHLKIYKQIIKLQL